MQISEQKDAKEGEAEENLKGSNSDSCKEDTEVEHSERKAKPAKQVGLIGSSLSPATFGREEKMADEKLDSNPSFIA